MGRGRGSSLKRSGLSPQYVQGSYCLKMSQDCSAPTEDVLLLACSGRWPTSGRWTSDGEFWTLAGSESPSVVVECSLSQILEPDAPTWYFLTPTAASGILRRAKARGKTLPERLHAALMSLAAQSGGIAI